MKNLLGIFFFLTVLTTLSSCEDVVQVEVDEGSELIVIDAFLESNFAGQGFFIHKNSAYFSQEKPVPVTNAFVTISDLTANVTYTAHHLRADRYDVFTGSNASLAPNHQYKMRVEIDGDVYTALTTQPRGASIDSLSAELFDGSAGFGSPVPPFYVCTVWAKDKADNIPDYYRIKASGNDTGFINICIDGTGGVVKDAPVDSLYFTPPYSQLGFQRYRPGDACYVEVHAITKSTYEFFMQALTQIQNAGLFAKTPENLKTNFISPPGAKRKAVGWFSVATVERASKSLP